MKRNHHWVNLPLLSSWFCRGPVSTRSMLAFLVFFSHVYISVGIRYFSQSKNLMMLNTRIFYLWLWLTVNILKIARSLNSFGCSTLSLTASDKSYLCYFLGLHSSKFNWPYPSCFHMCERKVMFPKEELQQKVIVKMEWENSWKMYRLIFNSGRWWKVVWRLG